MKYEDDINWEAPPESLSIPTMEEIHIYKYYINCSDSKLQSFYTTLSDDERKRADQYKFEKDRLRFISARAVLREIIGRYLDLHPSEIFFSYNSYGKPYLIDNTLNFNISHTNSLVMYIFANSKKVGIDVEYIHHFPGFIGIAQQFFSTQEKIDLCSIAIDNQLEAFFRCWTRKEAFIKAIGNGLSFPLNQFDVTLLPNEPARLIKINGDDGAANVWSMHSIKPIDDYECAFLFENIVKNIKTIYFNWQ